MAALVDLVVVVLGVAGTAEVALLVLADFADIEGLWYAFLLLSDIGVRAGVGESVGVARDSKHSKSRLRTQSWILAP